jgi:pimeloyl-ACP methyl ester carboxylesterase
MRGVRQGLVGAVLCAVLVAGAEGSSATTQTGGDDSSTGTAAPLVWTDCGDGAECARLEVPLDYEHREGKTIELAVLRVAARDPSRRIGSLVVNPGGPGSGGTLFGRAVAGGAPEELRDRFDIVGFDPRGTGESSPIRCGAALDAFLALDFSPTNKVDRAALIAGSRAYSRACKRQNGRLLEHVSTLETARDLDRLRAALGDEKLTYLGFSYGTYLGALYADRYPTRVRAMGLDGAIDPSLSFLDAVVEQSVGFERNLQHFLDHCAAEGTCAFAQGGDPGHAYDTLRARIEQRPLPVGDRSLTDSQFDNGVFSLLYGGQSAWPPLADALAAAQTGDGAPLLASADSYNERAPDGSYSPLIDAFYAIQCLDGPAVATKTSERVAIFWKDLARTARAAPRIGAFNAGTYAPCVTTLAPVHPAKRPTAEGAPPILIVNTTDDPATPLAGAEALARQLHSAVLVTEPGEGHALREGLSPCVADIATRYLVDLKVPAKGTTCP